MDARRHSALNTESPRPLNLHVQRPSYVGGGGEGGGGEGGGGLGGSGGWGGDGDGGGGLGGGGLQAGRRKRRGRQGSSLIVGALATCVRL